MCYALPSTSGPRSFQEAQEAFTALPCNFAFACFVCLQSAPLALVPAPVSGEDKDAYDLQPNQALPDAREARHAAKVVPGSSPYKML
jgi:hypothetical protein